VSDFAVVVNFWRAIYRTFVVC